MVSPKPISGCGILRAAISWASTLPSAAESPPPPYSSGQVGAVKPRSAATSSQTFMSGLL